MKPIPLDTGDVVVLTAAGERALNVPGTTLSARELEALVLVDGHSTVAELIRRADPSSREGLHAHLGRLLERGYLGITKDPLGGMIDAGDFFSKPPVPQTSDAQTAAQAAADAAILRQKGYCVNMARRGTPKEPVGAAPLNVLVIDDDPDIGALLQKYLRLEGLQVRMAGSAKEIVQALRTRPLPDIVLLDVDLPAVSGFHVLGKMREHPVLKSLPVIMLTGTATREAVLKGLLLGADGHVTKPFKIHALVRAVKAGLGLPFNPDEEDWDLSL